MSIFEVVNDQMVNAYCGACKKKIETLCEDIVKKYVKCYQEEYNKRKDIKEIPNNIVFNDLHTLLNNTDKEKGYYKVLKNAGENGLLNGHITQLKSFLITQFQQIFALKKYAKVTSSLKTQKKWNANEQVSLIHSIDAKSTSAFDDFKKYFPNDKSHMTFFNDFNKGEIIKNMSEVLSRAEKFIDGDVYSILENNTIHQIISGCPYLGEKKMFSGQNEFDETKNKYKGWSILS